MMLNAILPALAALPQSSQGQPRGQHAAGERPAFSELLSQAGNQLNGQALQPLPLSGAAADTLDNRNLLAQLIADKQSFASPNPLDAAIDELDLAVEPPVLDAVLNSDLATRIEPFDLDSELPTAAELADGEPEIGIASFAPPVEVTANHQQPTADPQLLGAAAALHPELSQNLVDSGPDKPALKAGAVESLRAEASLGTPAASEPAALQPPSAGAIQPNSLTGTAATSATASLNAPVATPEWNRELGQQVVIATRSDEQQVSIRLNPAELGPLQVQLKVVDQQAHVQFLSAHAQVRGAVEQALPQLREALAEQGITLADTSVGEHREHQQHTASKQRRGGAQSSLDPVSDDTVAAVETIQLPADGRVNIYV